MSLAVGIDNRVINNRSFLIGVNNKALGSSGTANNWLIGDTNTSNAGYSGTFAFGRMNVLNSNDSFAFGHHNTINHSYSFAYGSFLTSLHQRMHLYGRLNENSTYLTNPVVVVGSGYKILNSDPETVTAFEANNQGLVRLPHGLCLDSNTTIVNAITPPTDPSNPTIDEKTLVTKAYVASQVPSLAALQGITFKRTYTAVTGQITALTPGTDYNIETLFSITIPSWATHMKIGYDISSKQGYIYMNLGVVGNYPILIPDHDTSEMYSFILGWQPSTKELQLSYGYKWSAGFPAIDQNLGFSIMSIRFEGDYTPFPVNP